MVSAGDVCRLCLAMGARLHAIAGTPLQDIYEKLTEITFNTPRRPVVACHLCCCRLRKCHELMVRSVRADKVLTQILQSGEIPEQEFVVIIKKYHLDDGLCVTPTALITITNTEDGLLENEIKEEPQPTWSKVITTELIEFEESGGEGVTDSRVTVDMEDMDSEEFINENDIKVEVLEDPLNVEGQELTGVNIKLESFEVVQHNEPEGTAPSNICKEIQDRLTPHEKNILERRKLMAVLEEEISSRNASTYMLWSNRNAENKTQVLKNISTYVDTTITKDNSGVNSDNDCTSTKTDVDNSCREHLKKVVISDECSDVFDDKYLLVERTEHRNVGKKIINRKNDEGSSRQRSVLGKHKHTDTSRSKNLFECDICQRKFKTKCNLIIHFRRDTCYMPFECNICQVKFSQQWNLKAHLRTHTREKVFDCEICKVKFSTKSYLKIHFRKHTGEKPYECDICKLKFIEKSTLNRHLRTHKGEKPFECEICKAKFIQKSNLKIHFRTHTGEKPFDCDVCKIKFNDKSHLKMHLRTHTGEKPFECGMCKVKFSQKSTLNRHLRTHTDEKPFECEICKLKYGRQSYLKMHLRIHTGEKPFECEVCKAKFTQKSTLKTHFRTHTGEKPFECDVCKVKFTRQSYLKIHLRTHTVE